MNIITQDNGGERKDQRLFSVHNNIFILCKKCMPGKVLMNFNQNHNIKEIHIRQMVDEITFHRNNHSYIWHPMAKLHFHIPFFKDQQFCFINIGVKIGN